MDDPTPADGRIQIPPDVLIERLPDDDAVLLHLATEQYFGLDATGTAMWVALTESGTFESALTRLRSEFEVPAEVLRRDLHTLLSRLTAQGLLHVEQDPVAEAEAPRPR